MFWKNKNIFKNNNLPYPTTLMSFFPFFTAGEPRVEIYLCLFTVNAEGQSFFPTENEEYIQLLQIQDSFPQTGRIPCSKFTRTPASVCQKSDLNSC